MVDLFLALVCLGITLVLQEIGVWASSSLLPGIASSLATATTVYVVSIMFVRTLCMELHIKPTNKIILVPIAMLIYALYLLHSANGDLGTDAKIVTWFSVSVALLIANLRVALIDLVNNTPVIMKYLKELR